MLAWLFETLLYFASVPAAQRFMIRIAEELAKKTESQIDDQLVEILKQHLERDGPYKVSTPTHVEGGGQSGQTSQAEYATGEKSEEKRD